MNIADALLMSFCRKVEQVYGQSTVTPNMHLHGHLKEVLLDFGPAQEFWLFSFERYNGMLGKQDSQAFSYPFPQAFKEELSPLIATNQLVGSVNETLTVIKFALPTKSTRGVFATDCLEELYCKIHPLVSSTFVTVNSIFKQFSSITLRGKIFSSSGKRKIAPYMVMAEWKESLYGKPPNTLPNSALETDSNIRPVDAHFYLEASFLVNGAISVLHLAHVSWMFPHPSRYAIGKPAELLCRRKFESTGIHSFIPIDTLLCRCAHGMMVYNDQNVLVVIPLVE